MDLKPQLKGADSHRISRLNALLAKENVKAACADVKIWADPLAPKEPSHIWIRDSQSESFQEIPGILRKNTKDHQLHMSAMANIPVPGPLKTVHLLHDTSGNIVSFQNEHEFEAYIVEKLGVLL